MSNESHYHILISNNTRTSVDEELLAGVCQSALEHEKEKKAQLELHVVGDKRMRRWNNEYLNHDYTTDVLAFELGYDPRLGLCGMLVVCRPFAIRKAKELGISEQEELSRYVLHGCLHLLGYDDKSPDKRKHMWEVQETLLQRAFQCKSKL